MEWEKVFRYGIGIWCVMFVTASALFGYNIYDTFLSIFGLVFMSGALSFLCGGYVAQRTKTMLLLYGVFWAVIGIILDFLISARFDPTMFHTWPYWASYMLVFLAPILRNVSNQK